MKSLRLPAVVDFETGESKFYMSIAEKLATPATNLVRNGTNAAWISPPNDDRTVLASTNQIAKCPSGSVPTILPKASLSSEPCTTREESLNNIQDSSSVRLSRCDRLCKTELKVSRYGRACKSSPRFKDFVAK